MRVSSIQCMRLTHCLGAGACVAERIHSPFLSLFPSVAEHMDSMKLLRVLLSLSSSWCLRLSLSVSLCLSQNFNKGKISSSFFTEALNRFVCERERERVCVHACANPFFFFFFVVVFCLLFISVQLPLYFCHGLICVCLQVHKRVLN